MLSTLPFVSFIIPTFNEEKNIEKCLQGILLQNYPTDKFEVLVIDGLSTDKTQELARKYPVKLILNKKRSAAEARNIGVENAKGDILAFLDADSELYQRDWLNLMILPLLHDQKVAGAIPLLTAKRENPAISRFFSLMQADPLVIFAYGGGLDVKADYITDRNYFPMGLAVIRKALLAGEMNFKPSLARSEDVDITYRLVKNGYKFAIVKNAFFYHLLIGNFSGYMNKTYEKIRAFITSSDCEFTYIPKKDSKQRFLINVLYDVIGIGACERIILGIKREKDWAWLLYPFVLYSTLIFYFITLITSSEGRSLLRMFAGKI